MKLYLVRHGDYASSDSTQPLNKKGEDDIEKMAMYLKNRGEIFDEIWHSTKLRAIESAEIIARVFDCHSLKEKDCLSPNQSSGEAIKDLNSAEGNIAIVSHLPFIPKLLCNLIPDETSAISFFPTAAVAIVERVNGGWNFCEMITLELAD